MPTSTFFRLPEEKRQRLKAAAWEEFTQVKVMDVSINRIVQNAHIPRGSFYQYFTDKDDLFSYLVMDIREQFKGVMADMLQEENGDLFRLPLRAYDLFMEPDGGPFPLLGRLVSLLKLNRGMDLRLILTDNPGILPDGMRGRVNLSMLRIPEERFANSVFSLMIFSLVIAVMETLCTPEHRDQLRAQLEERISIIRDGSLAPAAARANEEVSCT